VIETLRTIDNMFYYVSIEKTLKLLLQQPQSWTLLDEWHEQYFNDSVNCGAQKSDMEIVDDWMNSEHGQRIRKYCLDKLPNKFPIFIQIYFDEVETVYPLGSKTGVHKLGSFYYTMKNFPPAANSATHNIHLLALAHADDLKKHGMDAVLKVVVEELLSLHDTGFVCSNADRKQDSCCLLTQVVGDNLGLHSLLGYMENFSRATFACDLCLASQDDIQQIFKEKDLVLRTADMYDKQISDLTSGHISFTSCGIKRTSVLSQLAYYHPALNDSADIMHDLFEGVIPCETKLFIHHVLYEIKPTIISLAELNRRNMAADYGKCNSRSKPSALTEAHMKSSDKSMCQRSSQMTTLFYFLPLLLSDILGLSTHKSWS